MNISNALLLCLLCVQGGFSVHIEMWDVKEYLNKLGDIVWEQLQEYGLSNLQDGDVTMFFNETVYAGYNITGHLHLEDGFVMDMKYVNATRLENYAHMDEEVAEIESDLLFQGISILRDFRYEPIVPLVNNDETRGSVLITPYRLYIGFRLTKNLTDDTVSVMMRFGGSEPGNDLMHFNPLNGLTRRLNNLHALAKVENGGLFPDVYDSWKGIFQKFLEVAVQKIDFPVVQFKTSRGSRYSR